MTKLSLKLFMLMTFLAFSTSSLAAEKGWITYAKVTKIVVTFGGGINVRLYPELVGCKSQSGYGTRYASVYPTHPGIDRIHSTLLAAYMADKPVAVYLVDNECQVGEIELGGR